MPQEQMKQKAGEVTCEALTSSVTPTPCGMSGGIALKPFDHSDIEEIPASCNTVFFYRKNAWSCKVSCKWPVSLLESPYLLEDKFQTTLRTTTVKFLNKLTSEISRI